MLIIPPKNPLRFQTGSSTHPRNSEWDPFAKTCCYPVEQGRCKKYENLPITCNATVSRRLQPSLFGPKIIKFRLNCFAHVQYLTLFWHANLYYRQHSLYGKYLASTHQSVKNSFVQCPIGLIWPMTKNVLVKLRYF